MTETTTMAIGLSLEEIDALLDVISSGNTPVLRLLRHRLWSLRVGLLQKTLRTGCLVDRIRAAHALDDHIEASLRLVTD